MAILGKNYKMKVYETRIFKVSKYSIHQMSQKQSPLDLWYKILN